MNDKILASSRKSQSEDHFLQKAEKYAKILAKTIISPEGDSADHGQNAYFYDAAEGLLASVVLMLSEFLPPEEMDGYIVQTAPPVPETEKPEPESQPASQTSLRTAPKQEAEN